MNLSEAQALLATPQDPELKGHAKGNDTRRRKQAQAIVDAGPIIVVDEARSILPRPTYAESRAAHKAEEQTISLLKEAAQLAADVFSGPCPIVGVEVEEDLARLARRHERKLRRKWSKQKHRVDVKNARQAQGRDARLKGYLRLLERQTEAFKATATTANGLADKVLRAHPIPAEFRDYYQGIEGAVRDTIRKVSQQ